MIKLILEIYAAVCVVATLAFVAWGLASRRRANSDVLETIKDFDQAIGRGRCDINPQTADMGNDAGVRSGPVPRSPRSPLQPRSKPTGVT